MNKTPKLSLKRDELSSIRKAGLRLNILSQVSPFELMKKTNLPLPRCEELIALSQFQSLGSVGPSIAEDLWFLGYRGIDELRDANPSEMYQRLMFMRGETIDPCVEDVFRCAVAQTIYPDLPRSFRQWWKWKDQRGQTSVYLPVYGDNNKLNNHES